jgi:hypothetical protein
MGSALGTTGLSVLATLAFVAAAILVIVADDKLRNITGYDGNSTLEAAHSNLVVAIILAWVAAAAAFILVLGYILTTSKILNNEWLHAILVILAVAAGIISIIYMGIAMRKINDFPGDDNSAKGFLLWSMIISGVGVIISVVLAMWRLTHHGTVPEKKPTDDMDTDSGMYRDNGMYNGTQAALVSTPAPEPTYTRESYYSSSPPPPPPPRTNHPPVHGHPAEQPMPGMEESY